MAAKPKKAAKKAKPKNAKPKATKPKAKEAPPPKMVVYHFNKPEWTTFAEVRTMDAVRQKQVLATLQIKTGFAMATMDDGAKALLEDGADESLRLARYEITRKGDGKPTYEMWVYYEEHGVVFEIGSRATPVHCVQRSFSPR